MLRNAAQQLSCLFLDYTQYSPSLYKQTTKQQLGNRFIISCYQTVNHTSSTLVRAGLNSFHYIRSV